MFKPVGVRVDIVSIMFIFSSYIIVTNYLLTMATCSADRITGLFRVIAVCTFISLNRMNTTPVGLNITQVL